MLPAVRPTLLMKTAKEIAEDIKAAAIVSFLNPFEFASDIPVIWASDLQMDVMSDSTIIESAENAERHLMDAAVQMYLCRNYTEGMIVGVLPTAILVHDMTTTNTGINAADYNDIADASVISAVIRLALDLAVEGREGRKVGTAFIVGNADTILKNSSQAVINPYKGQMPEDCDIKRESNWESVKEFAQLDGVFVIGSDGIIAAAGRFLNLNIGTISLPSGMGGRHLAVAAITLDFPVLGITVSESGGIVRIFRDGRCVQTIRSDIRLK